VLDPKKVDVTVGATEVDLPDHIKKSRPWKWAQQMSNTGNPYRQNTKSWKIFNLFGDEGCSIEQGIAAYVINGYDCEKLSFLLAIYEVVAQCVASGLLLISPETRKITICKGTPKAAPMP